MPVDLGDNGDRNLGGLDDLADPSTHPPPVVGVPSADLRQPLQQAGEFLVARQGVRVGVRGDAAPLRYPDAMDSPQLPQLGSLAACQCEFRLVELREAHHVFSHRRSYAFRGHTAAASRGRSSARVCTESSSSGGLDSETTATFSTYRKLVA